CGVRRSVGETPIGRRSARRRSRARAAAEARVPSLRRDMNIDFESLRRRRLIGYGAGLATLLTLRATPLDLEFIVDDKPESQGTELLGIPVVPPAALHRVNLPEYSVVIFAYTGAAIRAIQDKLAAFGLGFPDNWIYCSLLHFHSYRQRLKVALGVEVSPDLFATSRLLSIYTYPQNLSGLAGTWLYLELVRELNRRTVAGDVAELGVFEGGNALCSLVAGGEILRQRQVHLFDSFTGSPVLSSDGPTPLEGEAVDVNLAGIRNWVSLFDNVRIHAGFFEKTLPDVRDEHFAFVYYDADLYQPAIECCSFFYERLK